MGATTSIPSIAPNPLWVLRKQESSYTVYELPGAKEFTVVLQVQKDDSEQSYLTSYMAPLTREMKQEQARLRDMLVSDHVICSARVTVPLLYKETADPTTPVVVCPQLVKFKTAHILNWRLVTESQKN